MNAFTTGLAHGAFNSTVRVGLWAKRKPLSFWPTYVALGALTWWVGAQYGDWSMFGALKFWGASVLFGCTIAAPLLHFGAWVFRTKR